MSATAAPHPFAPPRADPGAGVLVNDRHSALNRTRVRRIATPAAAGELPALVRAAVHDGEVLTAAGGLHAMGGQQMARDGVLVDTRGMARVVAFDRVRGLVTAEAGIMWPELVAWLRARQQDDARPWTIRQKQTGADRLTLGGALSANVHGRGLAMRPFVDDVEAFTLVGPDGVVRRCSRGEHAALFRLAIGGYGLFGIVATVTLRLAPLVTLERRVVEIDADAVVDACAGRAAAGSTFGDFQFAIDPRTDDFLRRGILSTYAPVDGAPPDEGTQRRLTPDDWRELMYLAHADKARAYRLYRAHYLATDGQRYASDVHQLAFYEDGYHAALDRRLGARCAGSEMITELYVPRPRLAGFLGDARRALRAHDANVVYGTVRLIERDDETVLAWAREPWACIVLNLHVDHEPRAVERAAEAFRALVDAAIAHGGSYYLTYHRWATRAQVLACHPRLPAFLAAKSAHDPRGTFDSEWHRHHAALLAAG